MTGVQSARWLRVGIAIFVVALVAAFAVRSLPSGDSPTATQADGTSIETGVIDLEGAAPRPGAPAPNFVLADYEGNAVRLSDFRGKTVFLNFWATWCTTCASEMPDMQRLALEHADGLVVIAVNQAESTQRAKAWSDERGLRALQFAMDTDEEVTDAYKLPPGLPHSFFIDAGGVVRAVKHGGLSYDEMRRLFEETRMNTP